MPRDVKPLAITGAIFIGVCAVVPIAAVTGMVSLRAFQTIRPGAPADRCDIPIAFIRAVGDP